MIRKYFGWFFEKPNIPVDSVAPETIRWTDASERMPSHRERGTFVIDTGSFQTVAFWRPVKGFMEFTDINGSRTYFGVKRWLKLPD
tara:strand:- start:3647 stop:3904 length:258 start_codon:yes stop_codon:yes gene_type:complete